MQDNGQIISITPTTAASGDTLTAKLPNTGNAYDPMFTRSAIQTTLVNVSSRTEFSVATQVIDDYTLRVTIPTISNTTAGAMPPGQYFLKVSTSVDFATSNACTLTDTTPATGGVIIPFGGISIGAHKSVIPGVNSGAGNSGTVSASVSGGTAAVPSPATPSSNSPCASIVINVYCCGCNGSAIPGVAVTSAPGGAGGGAGSPGAGGGNAAPGGSAGTVLLSGSGIGSPAGGGILPAAVGWSTFAGRSNPVIGASELDTPVKLGLEDGNVYVISDLHIGLAKTPQNDFKSATQLVSLIDLITEDSLKNSGDAGAVLFLNGDILDIWSTMVGRPTGPYPVANLALLLTEPAVKSFFAALVRFMNATIPDSSENKPNRVVYLIGNHDDALWTMPGLTNTILSAVGNHPNFTLSPRAHKIPYYGFWVEHGHRNDDANIVRVSTDPAAVAMGVPRTAGEILVNEFLNGIEQDSSTLAIPSLAEIDNVIPSDDFIYIIADLLAAYSPSTPQGLSPIQVDGFLLSLENALGYMNNTAAATAVGFTRANLKTAATPADRVKQLTDLAGTLKTAAPFLRLFGKGESATAHLLAYQRFRNDNDLAVVVLGHIHEPAFKMISSVCLYVNTNTWTGQSTRIDPINETPNWTWCRITKDKSIAIGSVVGFRGKLRNPAQLLTSPQGAKIRVELIEGT